MIYTGPIDEFFDFRYGKLPYRSLEFRHADAGPQEQFQPVGTVNYPERLRLHAGQRVQAPDRPAAPEDDRSSTNIPRGRRRPVLPGAARRRTPRSTSATKPTPRRCTNVTFVGRLATYKYYNMDQVVGQALAAFKRLRQRHHAEAEQGGDAATAVRAIAA